ncbi:MAG: Rne/Rng family ribonuclease [Rikenellaceae bacterium]|jgi:ribonuclease G|nr:Rne/Rng family ribonuclease [Rikenellaceae bacterium]
MNKELIINVTSNEVTIALTDDKQLMELHKEECQTGFSVGDIYLGKVKKIMPGLNAAFVNIGSDKDAFIHFLDLGPQFAALQKVMERLGQRKPVDFSKLKLDQPIAKGGKIGQYISSGQTILVQVAKEAISTKGPRLTSDVSLAGRHLVLMPFSNKISFSQKIRSNQERRRLQTIVQGVLPKNYGVIVRTAALGKSDADIEQDIRRLVTRWESALARVAGQSAPALLSGEMSRITSILRDIYNDSFSNIVCDDKSVCDEVKEYLQSIAPGKEKIVKFYKGSMPIFDNFDVSKQIKSLFSKYVSLKRGAYLIIEHTEALHVIDVNSGNRAKVEDSQESTALDVNLQAAEEIARQLRLRDMGGIIVIDFIDLHRGEHRSELVKAMKGFMASDRAKHTILPISKFGLMQITRQRVRPQAALQVTESCPTCGGTGAITPTVLMDKQIENQIAYFASDKGHKFLHLVVNPIVEAWLRSGWPSLRRRWMWRYKLRLRVTSTQSTGFIEARFFDRNGKELE